MELEKEFKNGNFIKKTIVYPAYQTTHRLENLYSDVRTWVRELIQNADDAKAENIQFKIDLPKQVEVVNDGKPFDSNDIERLLTPCLGGKEIEKTGTMNLGALSVLSISDQPLYHSGTTLLKFEMNHEEEDFVPYINENYDSSFNGTRLILPFHSRLSPDNIKKLDRIDEYLTRYPYLLFTSNLKTVIVEYPNKKLEISKKVEKELVFKNKGLDASLIPVIITEKFSKGNKIQERTSKWLVAKRNVVVPNKYFNKKELEKCCGDVKLPVYFSFNFEEDLPKRVEYPLYIIFPSETHFGLGFVLSSNFRPETSRKGFSTEGISGELNIFLLKRASELIDSTLEHFKEEISSYPVPKRITFFNALLETLYYKETYSPLESYIVDHIYKKVIKFLEKNVLDLSGNWNKASEVVMADSKLRPFFSYGYYFINPPENERIKELLKRVGVKEITIKDLVKKVTNGEIKKGEMIYDAWIYLSIHQNELDNNLKHQLLNNNTLPNKLGNLTSPSLLLIPDEDAVGLYDPRKELDSEFIKNLSLKSFVQGLGINNLNPKEVLEYFVLKKSSLLTKDVEIIKNYYEYFHKFALLDKKRQIVLTNHGFKNPEEAFFNRSSIMKVLGEDSVPLVPSSLESSRICRMYLRDLGVSKELTAKHVMKLIKKRGSAAISINMLKFLSKNLRKLSNSDLKELEEMKLIPTTNNTFVKPSDCYLLTEYNKKILGDLVYYFNPDDKENNEWLDFIIKLGISKYPRIKHLRMALREALEYYRIAQHSKDAESISKVLYRIESIFYSIAKNDEKDEKEKFLSDLKSENSIPTNKGLIEPRDTYVRDEKILTLLGESVPYPLVKIPNKLVAKLEMKQEPVPKDVAIYLLNYLIKQKVKGSDNISKELQAKMFDKIYSYLGLSEIFDNLPLDIKKRLQSEPVIYVPSLNAFERPMQMVMFSQEAEMIYGNNRYLIRYSEYPNSFNFFRCLGIKNSVEIDDIADFLIEYCSLGDIDTKKLFMLYNSLGNRFNFLSSKKQVILKKSKIILKEDLKSFENPNNIFIADERFLLEKFSSINIAVLNDKIIDFLELVGVKKVSQVIKKNVVFIDVTSEDEFLKILSGDIKELVPYIEAIAKDTNTSLDINWKKRLSQTNCVICDQIFYELQFNNEKSRIKGGLVEFDPNKKILGIVKEGKLTNPTKFLTELSRAISFMLFINNIPNAKIVSPLIEKLLHSENKILTLKELGFSTFMLETKKQSVPEVNLKLPKILESHQAISNDLKVVRSASIYDNLPKISQYRKSSPVSWSPKKFNLVEPDITPQVHIISSPSNQDPIPYQKEQVNIFFNPLPSRDKVVDLVKEQLNKTYEIKEGKISNYFKVNNSIKSVLNKQKTVLYKSMEFPGKAIYGGLEITPPIPKLILESKNDFYYYIQQNLELSIDVSSLKKFEKMLKFIVASMEGNPSTVSVAVFNAPVEAFNFSGQLIFNYIMMVDNKLEEEFPLFLVWLMIAAHEIAHYVTLNHDQLHSKYMTIFALKALRNLESISQKYVEVYNE